MSRDCEHCKHYTWDLDRKYRSCECWECEFEKEDENEKEADILQEMANRNN